MPDVTIGEVPFQEAIDHLRQKLDIPTEHWDDMLGEAHAKGFTVAGAVKADLLRDFHDALNDALSKGTTITEFGKRFDEIVKKHGWSYKGTRGFRTRVIYDTNMRAARMAGKWKQFQRVKKQRPYLMYLTVGDGRVRPAHGNWDRTILPVDHPWWDTHFPPKDYGCRCTVRSLSERQLQKEGLEVSKDGPAEEIDGKRVPWRKALTERINPRTGEVYGKVPVGVGVGFDYNVGKAWLGPDIALGKKLMQMPAPLRDQALSGAQALAPRLAQPFGAWAAGVEQRGKATGEAMTVGYLSPAIIKDLEGRNLAPQSAAVIAADSAVLSMSRSIGDTARAIIRELPTHLGSPRGVLYDRRVPGLLYIFDSPNEKGQQIAVRVSLSAQGASGLVQNSNTVHSARMISTSELNEPGAYDLIQGRMSFRRRRVVRRVFDYLFARDQAA